jgi:putative colanic acid biosynthesis acetyltransferase WcaB
VLWSQNEELTSDLLNAEAECVVESPPMRAYVLQDWKANAASTRRVQVALVLFRIYSYLAERHGAGSKRAIWIERFYRLYAESVAGFELPAYTQVGARFVLWHGFGTVVNRHAVIGDNVRMRHNVTIGNRGEELDCPVIEDDVEIGVGATIVGAVRIGRGASIGAHSLVTFDVPPGGRVRAPRSVLLEAATAHSDPAGDGQAS